VRRGSARLRWWGAAAPALASLPLAALLGLAACEHAQPFGAPDLGPNAPFSTAFPRQLTFDSGGLAPAWLPDGSGSIYSFLRYDRPDRDRCLGVLPGEGGRAVQTICHESLLDRDSTNTLWNPAVGPGGVLAYVRESSVPGGPGPASRELVVATLGDPDPGRVIRSLPYLAPDGTLHATATHLSWVDAHTLVYVAEAVLYTFPPLPTDTILTPVEAVRISVEGDSVALSVVPGTAGATSVAADSSGAIYYTLLGDSRIYRLDPGAGAADTVVDFGAIGVVRDVRVAGGRVLAVAGEQTDADRGGDVYLVDPVARTAQLVAQQASLWFRRLAASPSGTRIAAEGYAVTPDGSGGTVVSGSARLYLLDAP
jgi:hypothetical protein